MPGYVEALQTLDSHERGILLQWATGESFALADPVRKSLSQLVNRDIPPRAFVAMDFTLDWLYAATVLVGGAVGDQWPRSWPDDDRLRASAEDFDLLVAWENETGKHTVLVEAKGFTGWSNKQMASKAKRLGAIFKDSLVEEFDVHLVLTGPAPSKGLDTSSWPDWMRPAGRVHFQLIGYPGERRAVQRCDASGKATKTECTHWQLVDRKWASPPTI